MGNSGAEAIEYALEACYIGPLNEDNHVVETKLTTSMNYTSGLRMAIDIEEKTHEFCVDAHDTSKDFMAMSTKP